MEGNVNLNPENGNFSSEKVSELFNKDQVTTSSFYSKIFLYFGLGILLTSVITIFLSWIFQVTMINNGNYDTFLITYLVVFFASFIVLLILNFTIMKRVATNGKSILVPYLLYSAVYGVLFSTIAALIQDPMVLGISLGMTALIFLSMCGFGYLSHNRISSLGRIIGTLFIAVALLAIVNLVILPFALFGGNYETYFAYGMIYWIIEAVILVIFILMTAYDFARIRKIAESGAQTNNIALYCALTIYSDFIAIFIQILRFVLIIAANRRR